MPHSVNLITTIAAALGVALIMGFIATRLKLPVLVGYLVAGILIGPATPGFVADIELSRHRAGIAESSTSSARSSCAGECNRIGRFACIARSCPWALRWTERR